MSAYPVFRVLVNISLRSVGRPYSSSQIDTDLDYIETYYTKEVNRPYYVYGMC
jgi:hypothetical protein